MVQLSDMPETSPSFGMLSDFFGLHGILTAELNDCFHFDCFGPQKCFLRKESSEDFNQCTMGKVGEWKASYFSNGTKTWIYGRLIIYTRSIRFVEDKEGTNGVDFGIFYEDFFELKKETTSVIFAAITVRVRADKYWFSSFTDRGYVFNTIEHFWKEKLFARYVKNFADCSVSNRNFFMTRLIMHTFSNKLCYSL